MHFPLNGNVLFYKYGAGWSCKRQSTKSIRSWSFLPFLGQWLKSFSKVGLQGLLVIDGIWRSASIVLWWWLTIRPSVAIIAWNNDCALVLSVHTVCQTDNTPCHTILWRIRPLSSRTFSGNIMSVWYTKGTHSNSGHCRRNLKRLRETSACGGLVCVPPPFF